MSKAVIAAMKNGDRVKFSAYWLGLNPKRDPARAGTVKSISRNGCFAYVIWDNLKYIDTIGLNHIEKI